MNSRPSPLTMNDVRAAFPPDAPRLRHIEGVVHMAEDIEAHDRSFEGKLILSAIYHDIGYSQDWRVTGFHAIDGAIAARNHGLGEDIATAILYHSGSWREMQLGHNELASHYAPRCLMMDTPLSRAMTYCDLHTNVLGVSCSLDERLADIRNRRGNVPAIMLTLDEYEPLFRAIDAEWSSLLTHTNSFKVEHAVPR